MKLWAKTIGLNQILLTSLTTVLLFSFLGELKVWLEKIVFNYWSHFRFSSNYLFYVP